MSYITYKQADSRWGKKNYNGSSSMAAAGCGPSSVAMLAYAVDGKTNPWTVAKYMQKNGYAIRNNGTAWSGIPAAMRHFGLKDVQNVNVDSSMSGVWSKLKDGYCAVFLFRAGSKGGVTWTTGGHYIAVTGYKVKDGKHYLYTRDSGGRNHTGWYCYETQMKGLIPKVWVGSVTTPKKTEPKTYKKAVDISAYQTKVDWPNVAVSTVILRAGYGKGNKDKMFTKHIKAAIKQKKNIGIYWFSYAYTKDMAKKEAEACLKIIRPYKDNINVPVYFDFEGDSLAYAKKKGINPSKALITDMTKIFCETIEKAGFRAGFYYNYDYKVNHYNMADLKQYSHWYALYSDEVPDCDIQQYSSSGHPKGFTGNIDVNRIVNPKVIGSTPKTTTEKKDSTTEKKESTTKTSEKKETFAFPSRGYFQLGDEGENVKTLQKLLNGSLTGAISAPIKITGKYDKATREAVLCLQDVRHITKDGYFGKNCLEQCEKKVTPVMKAINWAVSVARDSSFAYGEGSRAHNYGCYFCGTNVTGKKKAKKGSKWEKTYCCNPFVHAAFAHGTGDAECLKACKKGSGGGTSPETWTRYKCFKTVGKAKDVKYSDLKKGDLVMKEGHVWMFTGKGWLVEAAKEGWGASTIAHKKIAVERYAAYQKEKTAYVVRYKG